MLQAYPQGRPQEDPRVPLPWYVNEQYSTQPTLCACTKQASSIKAGLEMWEKTDR